ncbi:DUF2474 family protein [Microbulbifer harenosus]
MRADSSVWKRLGWMALIWMMSVATLGLLSLLLRWWLAGG